MVNMRNIGTDILRIIWRLARVVTPVHSLHGVSELERETDALRCASM